MNQDVPVGERDVEVVEVTPEHRGHRLGLALKSARLEALRERHPDLASIHTWTDPANHPMPATNRRVGYRAVERMHEVEHHDDDQDPAQ